MWRVTDILNKLGFAGAHETPIERVTSGVPIIDTNHAQIHAANAFSLIGTITVAQSKTGIIQISVPSTAYVHFQAADVTANGGPATVSLLEDYSLTSEVGASTLESMNHHRITNNASVLTVKALADAGATAGSAPKTLAVLPLHSTGTGSVKVNNEGGVPQEWILKPGKKYLVTFGHSVAGNCVFGYNLFWYEEGGA